MISRLDLDTGHEEEIYRGPEGRPDVAVSPDGKWLAFHNPGSSVLVLPASGGELQEIPLPEGESSPEREPRVMGWTAEGWLFVLLEGAIWRLHFTTQEWERVRPDIDNIIQVTPHPSGRRVAYTVEEGGSELWVLENLQAKS